MSRVPSVPFNFLALPSELSRLDTAAAVVLPIPYDSTTSYRGGARGGPRAIIEASYNLEDYDPELGMDVSQVGIHTAEAVEPHMGGPEHMVQRVRQAVEEYARQKKLVVTLGGEHSISVGAVGALHEVYPELSVLFLDAHADYRDEYMATRWGHASVARRIHESCPVVLYGTRSMSQDEHQALVDHAVPYFCWPQSGEPAAVFEKILANLTSHVYVSIDLDVLDPSLMAAVGTPEPGGMDWWHLTGLLRTVAKAKHIVGFDVTELSPDDGPPACAYTAAKLTYKMIAYSLALSPDGAKETS